MKKIYTILTLLLLSTFLYSQQEWAPIGAKWYQNTAFVGFDDLYPLEDYTIIESTGDTLIDGLNFRKVGEYFTCQDGDKIYFLWTDTLRLLYDFGVEVGDTVTFDLLSCINTIVPMPYIVDDVTLVEINGQQLKKIHCSTFMYYPSLATWPEQYDYIEKIGGRMPIENEASGYCVPIAGYERPWTRCYIDESIDYKTDKFLSFGDFDCDYQQTTATEDVEIPIFKIFPNPISNGQFYLKNQNLPPNAEVYIYNPLGQFISKEKWIKKKQIFSLPNTGLFYVMILSEGKRVATRVVVAVE